MAEAEEQNGEAVMAGRNIDETIFPVLGRVNKLSKGRHLVFTAIESLHSDQTISDFAHQYTEWMIDRALTEEDKKKAPEIAGENIGYALGNFDRRTVNRWKRNLSQIRTGPAADLHNNPTTYEALPEALRRAKAEAEQKLKG